MKTQSIRARFIRTFLCGLVLLGAAILPAGMAAQDALAPPSGTPAAGYSQPDAAKRAEAYYNYTMGHLNEVYYLNSSRSEFANAAIDFYKKPMSSTLVRR